MTTVEQGAATARSCATCPLRCDQRANGAVVVQLQPRAEDERLAGTMTLADPVRTRTRRSTAA